MDRSWANVNDQAVALQADPCEESGPAFAARIIWHQNEMASLRMRRVNCVRKRRHSHSVAYDPLRDYGIIQSMAKLAYLLPMGSRDTHDSYSGSWSWCVTGSKPEAPHEAGSLDEAIARINGAGVSIEGWVVADGCLDGRDLRAALQRAGRFVHPIIGVDQGLHVLGSRARYSSALDMREKYVRAASEIRDLQQRGVAGLRQSWDLEMNILPECWAMMEGGMRVDVIRLDRAMERFLAGAANEKEESRFYALKDLHYHMDNEGFVRPSVMSTGTITGRITTRRPNLQGASHDTIRPCLMPLADDCVFVSADYPQIEAWIAAKLSGDEAMLELLARGDLHRAVAAKAFHKAEDNISEEERGCVKQMVYGSFYGIGVKESATRLGVTVDQAEDLKKRIFAQCPKLARWLKEESEKAREDQSEFVELASGRLRTLTRGKEHYWDRMTARINGRIQGACADMLKASLLAIGPEVRALGGRVVLPVHDEIFCEAPRGREGEVRAHLLEAMRRAAEQQMGISIHAKACIGENFALETPEQVARGRAPRRAEIEKGEAGRIEQDLRKNRRQPPGR